ncbi:MAG: hypothetical protein ACTS8Y_04305 [Arsenophonus sp. ER-EMS1-MAG3]
MPRFLARVAILDLHKFGFYKLLSILNNVLFYFLCSAYIKCVVH